MSFRLRVLGLLMLVAMAATAATGWLTLRQANRQVQESVTAGRQEVSRVTGDLRAYGFAHGTWEGLSPTVSGLAKDTGQRIRVATENDVLLADSDALEGRAPRPVSNQPPVLVDPRPRLRIPAGQLPRTSMKLTATAIAQYRAEAVYAACLTRAGAEVTARPDDTGVPRISAERRPEQCKEPKGEPDPQTPQDLGVIRTCESEQQFTTCLQRVFNERVGSAAPPRLVIRLGVRDESPPTLAAAPTMAVAGGVALAAVLGALLLSRAVLRPVRAMTLAAGGWARGTWGGGCPSPAGTRSPNSAVPSTGWRSPYRPSRNASAASPVTSPTSCAPRWPICAAIWRPCGTGSSSRPPSCSIPSTRRHCCSSGSWTTYRISRWPRPVRSPTTGCGSTCASSSKPPARLTVPRPTRQVSRCGWRRRDLWTSSPTPTDCARSSAIWSATR